MAPVSRLNCSRDPGRHFARYRAPLLVLTTLRGVRGTQRAIDSGLVLIGQLPAARHPQASAYSGWRSPRDTKKT